MLGVGTIISPILKMRTEKQRKVETLTPGHIASMLWFGIPTQEGFYVSGKQIWQNPR